MTHTNQPDHEHDVFDHGYGNMDRSRANMSGWNDRTRGSGYDQHVNRGYDRHAGGYDRNFDRNMGGDRSYNMNDRGYERNFMGGYDRDRSFGAGGSGNQWNDRNYGGGNERDFDRFNMGQGPFGGNTYPGGYPTGNNAMGGYYPSGNYPGGYPTGGQFTGNQNRGGETWNQPGKYTGMGPKNFQRSDESIREDVCHRLTQHGNVDAHDIDVSVHNCEVTLKGTVDTRQMKRMAEEASETVPGVRDVHNQLQVNKFQQPSGTQGMQQNQHSENNAMQPSNSNSH